MMMEEGSHTTASTVDDTNSNSKSRRPAATEPRAAMVRSPSTFSNQGALDHAEDEEADNIGLLRDTGRSVYEYKSQARCFKKVSVLAGVIASVLLLTLIIVVAQQKHAPSSSSKDISPDAVVTAARLINSIDTSADPCDNFYQYACGRWEQSHEIPEDSASVSSFSLLYEDNLLHLKSLLAAHANDTGFKSPRYFKACMDETVRGSDSAGAFQNVLDAFAAEESTEGQFANLALQDVSAFFSIGVGADDRNASRNNLFLSQAGLGLPDRDYYINKTIDSDPILSAYATYIDALLAVFSLPAAADDIISIETQLAHIFIPNDELKDPVALYNPFTVAKLDSDFSFVRWSSFLSKIYASTTPPTALVVSTPKYFQRLTDLWPTIPKDQRVSYLTFHLISRYAAAMGKDVRALRQSLLEAVYGTATAPPLWRSCVSSTDDALGFELGRLFVDEYFTAEAKQKTDSMVESIRAAFLNRLDNVKWMDKPTRAAAKDKATAVEQKIGYPPFIKDDAKLREYYQDVTVGDLHLENYRSVVLWEVRRNFDDFFRPVDRSRWGMTPATVNAYYSPSYNEIVFPAGILQTPFFSHMQPDSLNFGGMGVVIGHELSHGFDDQGRQYDKNGNLRQWWTNDTINNFKDRAQCFINQYDQYVVNGDHVNGKLTLGENIADNGGVHTAYAAYQSWRDSRDHADEDVALPGLELNSDQLFFIGFAQVWCSKFRPEEAHNRILTDVHSPAKYRVIGAVSNSQEFFDAFSCPDPKRDMCRLW